jgi:hypothetical protein
MARKRKAPDPGAEKRSSHDAGPFRPDEKPVKGAPGGPPGPAAPTPRSEDFGRRRDIETADEPAEEHDRRHHDEDAEVGRPA